MFHFTWSCSEFVLDARRTCRPQFWGSWLVNSLHRKCRLGKKRAEIFQPYCFIRGGFKTTGPFAELKECRTCWVLALSRAPSQSEALIWSLSSHKACIGQNWLQKMLITVRVVAAAFCCCWVSSRLLLSYSRPAGALILNYIYLCWL